MVYHRQFSGLSNRAGNILLQNNLTTREEAYKYFFEKFYTSNTRKRVGFDNCGQGSYNEIIEWLGIIKKPLSFSAGHVATCIKYLELRGYEVRKIS